jgi:pantoate--beta-alanine ligase
MNTVTSKNIRILHTCEELKLWRAELKSAGNCLALVPTMGNLHEGHFTLVNHAKKEADAVLATLFINPLQFGPGEDFERYPRTFKTDVDGLESIGCTAVFAPSLEELSPNALATHTTIHVPILSELHCGASRPSHFDGVCTIVLKLFNIAQPDCAIFGLKDLQQFRIISNMVEDLAFDVRLISHPIIRAEDGLALSSRNGYLSEAERQRAPELYRTLRNLSAQILHGARDLRLIEASGCNRLAEHGFVVDYLHICDAQTLQRAETTERLLAILGAAWQGKTRLIDNIIFSKPTF